MAKVSAGGIGGFGTQSTALLTDDAISVIGGGEKTSYSLGGSYRHTGEWMPSYHLNDWNISAGGQTSQGPLKLSSSLRYANKAFDFPWDTRFQAYTYYSQPFYTPYHLRQETYGLTASVQATQSWQHTLTLGYDRSNFDREQTQPRFTTPADSFLLAEAYYEAKASVLYHTDVSLRIGPAATAVVTAGINYDSYDYVDSYASGPTHTTGTLNGPLSIVRTPWTNTGYFSQVQLAFGDRLFLTGGLRAERNDNFGAGVGTAWSPRFGLAYVLGLGQATLKLRGSYGESIRAPSPGQREAQSYPGFQILANPALAPERQRGADGGVEVYLGRASLGITYYNQRAIDLIQFITLTSASGQYQNLARVKNEGWELEGRLPLGPLQLAGTYSITNSTVLELPPGYPAGGYQVGDPILGIPHTSAGASVAYSPLPQTRLTVSMTHFGHWTERDWVALYGYYFGGQPYRGSDRAYWIEYPTVTKVAVSVSQMLMKGFTAFARAENLGNNHRYEGNNFNIPTPRSVLVGANVRY
jgi:outer membrane receptor protein involved in Fe transport